jgi:8-oxo-dGTP pyrophosphatase MutT (NUDIX family)
MTTAPRDNDAYRFPVSVKGVVLRGDTVILVKNRRDEWELPGGKLERSEEPAACVTREIEEELRLSISPDQLLDAWVYTIGPGTAVLVVSYGCTETSMRDAVLSDEHTEFDWIPLGDVETLRMPAGYKSSIRRWAAMVQSAKHQVGAVRRA